MAKVTMKDLRVQADEMIANGVARQEDLLAALPVMMKLKSTAASIKQTADDSIKVAKKLAELCTKYATAHPSVFENRQLVANQQGVLTGDVVIDEETFHLACGYDGYMRIEKGVMTQAFLEKLPEAWRKSKLELNTTGINKAAPTEEELAEYGLKDKPNNVWSVQENA